MKRCPECGREYDNSMKFCLDDGAELLYGPATMDEPETAVLSAFGVPPSGGPAGESPTRVFHTGEAEPPDKLRGSPERQSLSAHRAAEPQEHRSVKPLIAVAAAIAVLLAGGFFGYRYFSSAGTEQIKSIAVLPFENRSGSADAEYLSDGLADSLIYRLSQLPKLKVSPTSSVMRYKGKETDVAQIASELKVDAVMSGRLMQRGDDLSISVQLIDSRSGKLVWAEQYDRKMAELLATQREIATTITQKLQLKLSGDDAKGVTKKYTDNNDAYQLYLKGRYHLAKRTKDDILKGIDYFRQAITLDPNFALAFSSIAESYNVMPSHAYLSNKEATPKAREAVEKALAIDPSVPEAHVALASVLTNYDWNWVEAEREFKRAIELGPEVSTSHFRYGQYLWGVGRLDESIAEMSKAVELEPVSLNTTANLALIYLSAGQLKRGLELAKTNYDLEPGFVTGQLALGIAYNSNGSYADAIRLSETCLQTDPTNQHMLLIGGYAYAKLGDRKKADAFVDRFREIAKTGYVSSYYIGSIYAALGEKDRAFEELENSFEARDWWLIRMKFDPLLESLRDEARFKSLLKRMNLPE